MIRRMWLHSVPEELFGCWSGEMVLDVDGVAPQSVLFCGDLEGGFERSGHFATDGWHAGPWRPCGAVLNRELATVICKVRLQSWMTAGGDWEE